MARDSRVAPGEIEILRRFLETWSMTQDKRVPVDHLPRLLSAPDQWAAVFPAAERVRGDSLKLLRQLRDDLRASLLPANDPALRLNKWLDFCAARIEIYSSDAGIATRVSPANGMGFVGQIVSIATEAIIQQRWSRLKMCPDCQTVFYDSTRNESKKWCGMSKGGPEGRACGTIAKVRRFRQRQRVATIALQSGRSR